MKKKILSGILSAVMAASLLAGCGQAAQTTTEAPAAEPAATEAPAT